MALFVWLIEMPDDAGAAALLRELPKDGVANGRQVAGVACGRLFALIAKGSGFAGRAPFESAESLAVLAESVRAEMARSLASIPEPRRK